MVSSAPDLTGRILRHERALVVVSITALATLCWWYVAHSAATSPNAMVAMGGPPVGALIVMWWLMMIAMMLPSAAPAILLYSRIRESRNENKTLAQTWVFLTGYLTVWLLFSIIAAFAQRLFTGASMALHNHVAEAALLIGSGLYQLSPAKIACVRQCRSPAEFLTKHWRPGLDGAVRLGVSHGAYCLGCCWLLMALLFVGGIMNVLWIAGLTLLVAGEKLLQRGDLVRRASAITLLLWGAARLLV